MKTNLIAKLFRLSIAILVLVVLIGCGTKKVETGNHDAAFDDPYFEEISTVKIDENDLVKLKNPELKSSLDPASKDVYLHYTIENLTDNDLEIAHYSYLEKLFDGTWRKQKTTDIEFPAEMVTIAKGSEYTDNFPISFVLTELLNEEAKSIVGQYRLIKEIPDLGTYALQFEINKAILEKLK